MNNSGLQLVQQWLQAICSHNLQSVLNKYSKKGILIGTLAKKILVGPQIESYFVTFLQKPGLCGEINEYFYQNLGSIRIVSGIYTFYYYEHQKRVTVPARFSFVFKKIGKDWLILNHHSSKIP